MNYLGIEIGGTKLQVGVGRDDGSLLALWRGTVDVAEGPDGIRRQIVAAVPEVLAWANLSRADLRGVGVGFGGPVDDATRTVIKSHQIEGWDGFPLADWIGDLLELPTALGNDADVAGLAEALHGAGKGLSPIFYITIGSGIGGGLIIDGEIYRGVGRGAAEIGHLYLNSDGEPGVLEKHASGWGIEQGFHDRAEEWISAREIADRARNGVLPARLAIEWAVDCLAFSIAQVIALLCPRRVVIGGGISLIGEDLLFAPLRRTIDEWVFPPFAKLTDIVPAALGEEVVIHGAIALARKQLS